MLDSLIASVEAEIEEGNTEITRLYLFREAAALAKNQDEVERLNDYIANSQHKNKVRKARLVELLAFRPHFEAGYEAHAKAIREVLN